MEKDDEGVSLEVLDSEEASESYYESDHGQSSMADGEAPMVDDKMIDEQPVCPNKNLGKNKNVGSDTHDVDT